MRKTLKNAAALAAGLLLALGPVSCTSEGPDDSKHDDGSDDSKQEIELTPFTRIAFTEEEQAAIDAAKPFGLDLFRKYCELSGEDNVLISPLSAILDLGVLANGAAGETQTEILEALGWGPSGLEDMNAYARRLMSEYSGMDQSSDVMIANGIFNRNDVVSLKKEYTDKMKSIYDAEWRSYDENSYETEVSKWISEKTGGLIKDMDLGYKEAKLSLLNALYFKGIWLHSFDKNKTISDTFTCSDGSISNADYFGARRLVGVNQNEYFTCVLISIGNGAYTIAFLLPDEERGLDACLADVDIEMWDALLHGDGGMDVNLRIPKFELAHASDFEEALKELGIRRAFSSKAQLNNMLRDEPSEMAVTNVKQGCTFSIDENGVTASATTVINIGETSPGPLEDGGDFFLNRPFLYAITENSSGAILFMGKIGKL